MKTPRGFSILEILIAMAIILMAIAAVTLMSPGTQSTSVDAALNIEGLNLAQELLENQQSLARKDFKLVNPVATTTNGQFQTAVYATSTDFFTKRVTAQVTWTPQYGRTQSVSLSTLVSNFQNVIGGDTCGSILSGNWASPQTASTTLLGSLTNDASGAYPVTDVDVYQKRLYVSVNGTSQNTGAKPPTLAINKGGTGTVAWSPNPATTNVSASDSLDASAALGGTATSNYLWASGFGPSLNIPKGATILGISIVVRRSASNSGAIVDSQVRLVRPDGTSLSYVSEPAGGTWSTSEVDSAYGSASDLWGEKWTASDINDPDFGVAFSARNTSGSSRTAKVDSVSVAVTYARQFYVLDEGNPTSPTRTVEIQTATTSASGAALAPVATGFTGVAVATSSATGSYAFVSTNSTVTQLEVIDIGTSTPTIVTNYTPLSASVSANTIFYKDGYIYLGLANNPGGPELYILDVHNPLSIPTLLSGNFVYEVGAGINAIYVKNNKVYLATDDASRELVILDVNDLAHPTLYAIYNAPNSGFGTGLGRSVYTVGDTLYFGRYYMSTAPEFYVINTTTSTSVVTSSDPGIPASPLGVYGVLTRDYLNFLVLGSGVGGTSGGKLVIQHATTTAPVASVTLQTGGPGGVALDCEGNHLYVASVDAANRGWIKNIYAQ